MTGVGFFKLDVNSSVSVSIEAHGKSARDTVSAPIRSVRSRGCTSFRKCDSATLLSLWASSRTRSIGSWGRRSGGSFVNQAEVSGMSKSRVRRCGKSTSTSRSKSQGVTPYDSIETVSVRRDVNCATTTPRTRSAAGSSMSIPSRSSSAPSKRLRSRGRRFKRVPRAR